MAANPVTGELQRIRNRLFDELAIADTATIQRTLTRDDLQFYALQSGDVAPVLGDREHAATLSCDGVIAHGMWVGALVAAVIGTRLPGPGTVYRSQQMRFLHPVQPGDTVQVTVTVAGLDHDSAGVTLACACTNQAGQTVLDGVAEVTAPSTRIERTRTALPEVRLGVPADEGLQRLLAHVRPLGHIRMAVVHPCDALSLSSALDAMAAGLIEPVLVTVSASPDSVAKDEAAVIWMLQLERNPRLGRGSPGHRDAEDRLDMRRPRCRRAQETTTYSVLIFPDNEFDHD